MPGSLRAFPALSEGGELFRRRLLQRRPVCDGAGSRLLRWAFRNRRLETPGIVLDKAMWQAPGPSGAPDAAACLDLGDGIELLHTLDGAALVAVDHGPAARRILPVVLDARAAIQPWRGEPFCWRAIPVGPSGDVPGPVRSILAVAMSSRHGVALDGESDNPALPQFTRAFRRLFLRRVRAEASEWIALDAGDAACDLARFVSLAIAPPGKLEDPAIVRFARDIQVLASSEMESPLGLTLRLSAPCQDAGDGVMHAALTLGGHPLGDRSDHQCVQARLEGALRHPARPSALACLDTPVRPGESAWCVTGYLPRELDLAPWAAPAHARLAAVHRVGTIWNSSLSC